MLVYSSRKENETKCNSGIYLSLLFEWVFISSVHMQHDCEIYCTIIHLIIASWLLWCFLWVQPTPLNLSSTPDSVSCWLKHFTVQILLIQISFDFFAFFNCLWLLKASAIFLLAYVHMIDTSLSQNHTIIFLLFSFLLFLLCSLRF